MDSLTARVSALLNLPLIARARAASGIDRAIFYTVLNRGWSAISGPITLFFVARFLSPDEQGFFYTFSSVLALHMFFELGLAYVIMQAVSHEKAHLEWTPAGTLTGDPVAKARLASIFRLALRWYFVVGLLVLSTLTVVGFIFFARYQPEHADVHWQIPWFLVVFVTGVALMVTPLWGVLEGCGKVADLARVGAVQGIVASLVVWATLTGHGKLFAGPAVAMASLALGAVYMAVRWRGFFFDLLRTPIPPGKGVSWRYEILPFQWKMSLSWLSGYFIFQLANPVLFRFHGAAEAGRMGMTMRVVDSIMVLGVAWVSTKSAPFGGYVARRDFETLDRVFWKASLQSVAVVMLGGIAFLALYYALRFFEVAFINRLLDPLSITLLLGSAVMNCIIFNQAMYLRAHKQEPFLYNSLLGAVMVPVIMYLLGRPYGALGIAAGSFGAGLLVSLPLATAVFYKKRREWHLPA